MAACGDGRGNSSLRDALDALPRDTAPGRSRDDPPPTPTEVDDTVPAESTSAVPPFPAPRDTDPWVLQEPSRVAAPGEWTTGVVALERPVVGMTVLTGVRTALHP